MMFTVGQRLVAAPDQLFRVTEADIRAEEPWDRAEPPYRPSAGLGMGGLASGAAVLKGVADRVPVVRALGHPQLTLAFPGPALPPLPEGGRPNALGTPIFRAQPSSIAASRALGIWRHDGGAGADPDSGVEPKLRLHEPESGQGNGVRWR